MNEYQFQWRSSSFFVEDVSVEALAESYGTPLNVVSQTQLVNNLTRFQAAFGSFWPGEVRILPAIKGNTSSALCRVLAQHTQGCDLFSEGEMSVAIESGFTPACISLNGNSKLDGDLAFLEKAVASGVRITLDDATEFDAIEALSKKLGVVTPIRFRVRPDFPKMQKPTDFLAETISSELANTAYKAGIPTEGLLDLGKRALASQHVKVTGLHLHLGRHRSEIGYWEAAMEGYALLIGRLSREWGGWSPAEVDIGGGFAPHLDQMNNTQAVRSEAKQFFMVNVISKIAGFFGANVRNRAISALLRMSRNAKKQDSPVDLTKEIGPTIEDYGLAICRSLSQSLLKEGLDPKTIRLELEPGRGIFGNAAMQLSRVNFVKHQTVPIPWSWVVTDTTEWFLNNAALGHPFPLIVDKHPLQNYPTEERMICDIVGKSCSADRIQSDACLPNSLGAGDVVGFIGTGAYAEMMSCNMNSIPRPATVIVNGDKHELIRRRETLTDVFGKEVMPSWLEPEVALASAL